MSNKLERFWYVRCQVDRYAKHEVLRLDEALDRAEHPRTDFIQIATRGHASVEEAEQNGRVHIYQPWIDFDAGKGLNPVADCASFIANVLRPAGLKRDVHYVVAASSTGGGRKIIWKNFLPPEEDWDKAWRHFCDQQKLVFRSIDPAIATTSTTRWIGSSHRKGDRGWQRVLPAGADDYIVAFPPNRPFEIACNRPGFLTEADCLSQQVHLDYQWHSLMTRCPSKPSAVRKTYRGDYQSILRALNEKFEQKHRKQGAIWLQLNTCPYCKANRKAAVSPSGFLACFRESCPAHGGIHPGEWIQVLGGSVKMLKPQVREEDEDIIYGWDEIRTPCEIPLETARATLHTAMESAFSEPEAHVMIATPGVGKSYEAMRQAGRAGLLERKQTVFLGPTRALSEEAYHDFSTMTLKADWILLEGRNPTNCEKIELVRAAGRVGLRPGSTICRTCEFRTNCKYFEKLDEARKSRTIFSVWEHISLVESGFYSPDAVVMDEFPARYFLQEATATPEQLLLWTESRFPQIAKAAQIILDVYEHVASDISPKVHGKFGCVFRGDEFRAIVSKVSKRAKSIFESAVIACEFARDIPADAYSTATPEELDEIPPLHVLRVIEAVEYELRTRRNPRVSGTGLHVSGTGVPRLKTSWIEPPATAPRLSLDAYAVPAIYERIFRRPVSVHHVDAKIQAKIWQVPISTNKASYHRDKSLSRILSTIKDAYEVLKAKGHEKILVLTWKSHRDIASHDLEAWERHAYEGAGVNFFSDFTACICAVTPSPSAHALRDMAGALWLGDDRKMSDDYVSDRRAYSDERMNTVLHLFREAEMAQQIHRIRPALPSPAGMPRKEIVIISKIAVPALPRPSVVLEASDIAICDKIDLWASQRGWWSDFVRGLVLPFEVERPTSNSRAARRYTAARDLSVTGLPKIIDTTALRHDDKTFSLGPVWGDVDAARSEIGRIVDIWKADGMSPVSEDFLKYLSI